MHSDIRFGLVGFGLFGKHHAQAIAGTPGCRLAAICAASSQSREAARCTFPDATVYADYLELLARRDLDIVDVVTPNQTHWAIGLAALRSGRHLLLEKPMALTIRQCDELNEVAMQRGCVLAVGHELRLSSLWGEVKALLNQGAVGAVQHVLIELSRFPYRPGSTGWRYDRQRVGSWILEEPIHFFDLANWYLAEIGPPISVYARGNSRDPLRSDLYDNFSAVVNYPQGAYAVVSQTLAAFGHHQTVKVVGTQGTIWAWWSAADARDERPRFGLSYGMGATVTEATPSQPAGELLELADQIRAVAASVRNGTAPPCNGRDGREAVLLCLAAEAALRNGREITLAEYMDAAE